MRARSKACPCTNFVLRLWNISQKKNGGFWCLLTESVWLLAGLSPPSPTPALLKSMQAAQLSSPQIRQNIEWQPLGSSSSSIGEKYKVRPTWGGKWTEISCWHGLWDRKHHYGSAAVRSHLFFCVFCVIVCCHHVTTQTPCRVTSWTVGGKVVSLWKFDWLFSLVWENVVHPLWKFWYWRGWIQWSMFIDVITALG